MLNMGAEVAAFAVPTAARYNWHLAADTAAESPADLFDPADQPALSGVRCPVAPRSVVVLEGR